MKLLKIHLIACLRISTLPETPIFDNFKRIWMNGHTESSKS